MNRTLIDSISNVADDRCVDFFRNDDGRYSFEEYRRDAEDPSGWFPIGGFDGLRFTSREAAVRDAQNRIAWFGAE